MTLTPALETIAKHDKIIKELREDIRVMKKAIEQLENYSVIDKSPIKAKDKNKKKPRKKNNGKQLVIR